MKKLIICILSVFVAFLATFIIAGRTNTLEHYKNWDTSKGQLAKPVSTTIAFMTTRPALARGRLNLNAWNGYNEVYSRPLSEVKEVRFKLFLSPQGFLAVGFNRTDSGYDGLLLSSSYLYRNCFFQAGSDGEFVSKEHLSPYHLKFDHVYRIRMVSENGKVAVYADGKEIYVLPVDFQEGAISFRGGEHPVFIDDIQVRGEDGQMVLNERFSHPAFLFIFLPAFLVLMLITFWTYRRFSFPNYIVAQISLISVLLIFGSVDYFVLAARYPKYEGALKRREEAFLAQEEKRIEERIAEVGRQKKTEGEYRILVLGSSQTWGSGVLNRGDEFTAQWERRLKELYPSKIMTVINAGICGSTAERLYELYASSFIRTSPDVVIINLSNNDSVYDERPFVEYLVKFIDFNNKKGIKTVFILEPNCPEHRCYLPLHPIMREVAKKYNIPVWDANSFLAQRNDKGFLWWDWVHLSSFGHRLMADFLTDRFVEEKILKKD